MVKRKRTVSALAAALLGLVATSASAQSPRDPAYATRMWSMADGLAHERVNCVMQDHKGWIWLGTWEGVSRFDGREFKSYGLREGLPNPFVNTIVEDAAGRIWAGTNGGGIVRLLDEPAQRAPGATVRFAVHRLGPTSDDNTVDAIHVDAEQRIWCAAQTGLYRARIVDGSPESFEAVLPLDHASWVPNTVRDRGGRTWFANDAELVAVAGDRVERTAYPAGPASRQIRGLAIDADDRLLVATRSGLLVASREANGEMKWSEPALSAPLTPVHTLLVARDGATWIGTQSGAVRISTDGTQAGGVRARWLRDEAVYALMEDRAGNIWAGTWSSGVGLLAPSAVRSWTTADGLPNRSVLQVVLATDGRVIATTEHGTCELVDGELRPVPGSDLERFAHVGMNIAQSRDGRWWLGTDDGLWSVPGPALDYEKAQLVAFEPERTPTGVFGRILVAPHLGEILFGGMDQGVYALDADTPGATCRSILPPSTKVPMAAREFLLQSDGVLWLAPFTGLYRRRNGAIEDVGATCGVVEIQPRFLHQDRRGRVWLGTRNDGLYRIDDPSGDRPRFERVAGRDELGTGVVWAITEDERGRLWLATGHGLVRFEPEARNFTAFTTRDGLAGDIVPHCVCAANGLVWAATSNGLSVVDSTLEPPPTEALPTYLTRLRIAGADMPLPETGAERLPALELGPDQDDVEVAFASPAYGCAGPVRWQHRLAEDAEWSAPVDDAHVRFARLAPGTYGFEVRSVTSTGRTGPSTAGFALTILPPVWQRAWFLALAAIALGAAALLLHRARVRRVLALERIRSQIASDLHDDLGAGLAQIAILSEVARRDSDPAARGHLAEIAGLARTMRESVGEIVWAIDPRKDQAGELVRRMRQTAYNLLDSEGVNVDLRAPPESALEKIGLAPDQRRHLLLVAKEALTNAARHAHASNVEIEISVTGSTLVLAIQDDGQGFDSSIKGTGHGLSSLERRAQALGAQLSIRSVPGEGTRIELAMPISRPHIHAVARGPGGG